MFSCSTGDTVFGVHVLDVAAHTVQFVCTVVAEQLFTMRPRQEDVEGAGSSVSADDEGPAEISLSVPQCA